MVCPTYNTWGLKEVGRELTYPDRTSPHSWGTNLRTIPLHIHVSLRNSPHISLSWTVCEREIWVLVKFITNFSKCIPDLVLPDPLPFRSADRFQYAVRGLKAIGAANGKGLARLQPLGEDSDSKSPSFQHPPQVCKVGHTTH